MLSIFSVDLIKHKIVLNICFNSFVAPSIVILSMFVYLFILFFIFSFTFAQCLIHPIYYRGKKFIFNCSFELHWDFSVTMEIVGNIN